MQDLTPKYPEVIHFKLSTIELDRPGPSYSVETLLEIKEKLGSEADIYFILGFDLLTQLPSWKDPQRLVELCYLVPAPRPGYADFDLKQLDFAIPGISSRIILLDVPQIDISSTEIRKRVAQNLPVRYLVPEAVERYIMEHGIYK